MHQHQKDKQGPTTPSSNDSMFTLEQQRQVLAEDIAILVVHQHRRQNAFLGDPVDATKPPAMRSG